MKLAVLFSGGKDSNLALLYAKQHEDVVCLITISSKNPNSYMFHTPNIEYTKLQAKKLGIPIIYKETLGEKEIELADLKLAIQEAITTYGAEGVVTGAVESVYQASRIQKICHSLNLECFNPLWQKDQMELLKDIVKLHFKAVIVGVAAYPLDDSWLGKIIDESLIARFQYLKESIKVNPAGEGGEYETFIIDGPTFSEPINITKSRKVYADHAGVMIIEDAK